MKKTKKVVISKISSIKNSLMTKERFNPYQTGHGIIQSKKNPKRAKRKKDERQIIMNYS